MNKEDTFNIVFFVLLLIACIFAGVLGFVEKREQDKQAAEEAKQKRALQIQKQKEKEEKEKAFINRATEEEKLIKTNWAKTNPDYKISFQYNDKSTDFNIIIDIPKKDYDNYVKYKENEDVRKTWNKLLNVLKKASKDGYEDFASEEIFVNYYFNVRNPTNVNEYIAIIKNGEIEKDFMNP